MNKFTIGFLMILFGGVLAFVSIPDAMAHMKKPVWALEQELGDLKPGDHVKIDVTAAAACMLSETTTTKSRTGTVTSSRESARYYLLPVVEEEGRDIVIDHMLILRVTDHFSQMDSAVRSFNNWWDDDWAGMDEYPDDVEMSVDGRVRRMSSKERRYIEDYLDDPDYEDWVEPYVIVTIGKANVVYIFSLVGILLVAGGLALAITSVVKDRREAKANEAQRQAEAQARAAYYQAPGDVQFNNDSQGQG